jgi:hypothetical protein
MAIQIRGRSINIQNWRRAETEEEWTREFEKSCFRSETIAIPLCLTFMDFYISAAFSIMPKVFHLVQGGRKESTAQNPQMFLHLWISCCPMMPL